MQTLSIGTVTDGVLGVVLRGEIDFSMAHQFAEELGAAVQAARPATVRVDLSEVTFLDSAGIALLVTGWRAATSVGATYRVEHPNRNILDQLDIAGLLTVFGLAQPAPET